MLDVVIGRHTWNCQIRTHIRDTHTQAHTQKNKKIKSRKIRGEKKREKGGRKKKEGKKKREGDGFRGVEGVLRRAGPHTNNARST